MDNVMEKITDSELEIMKVLWAAESPLPLSTIRSAIQNLMSWESATIKTLLARLVSKKAVSQQKREVFYYSPLVSEEEYDSWATTRLIERLYNGKAGNLVAALLNADGITADDIDELRRMFLREE